MAPAWKQGAAQAVQGAAVSAACQGVQEPPDFPLCSWSLHHHLATAGSLCPEEQPERSGQLACSQAMLHGGQDPRAATEPCENLWTAAAFCAPDKASELRGGL